MSISHNFTSWIFFTSISIFFLFDPVCWQFFIEYWILCKIRYRRSVLCYHSLKRIFFSFLASGYNRSKSHNPIRDSSDSRLSFCHYKIWFISSISLFLGCSSLGDPKAFGIYQRVPPGWVLNSNFKLLSTVKLLSSG